MKILDISNGDSLGEIYFQKKGGKIIVSVSDKLNKIFFSNGEEHYILKNGCQENVEWIKDKFVRRIVNYNNSFFLITSKDYDRDIDIIHAEYKSCNMHYIRFIEPGLLDVFDSVILKSSDRVGSVLQTLTKIGDCVYLDSLEINEEKLFQGPGSKRHSTVIELTQELIHRLSSGEEDLGVHVTPKQKNKLVKRKTNQANSIASALRESLDSIKIKNKNTP